MGKLRLLFSTSALGGGGAEMHLLRVMNHLDRARFEVSLALVRRGGSYERALRPDIEVHELEAGRSITSVPALRKLTSRLRPDVLCSVMDHSNVAAILARRSMLRGPKSVAVVQVPPSIQYPGSGLSRGRALREVLRRVYPMADQMVSLSEGVADDLRRLNPSIGRRLTVIYNAGVDARVREGAQQALPDDDQALLDASSAPLIVACGRLTKQKGFPHLLDAMARLRQRVDARLWIIGEGEDRSALEQQVQRLGLQEHVRMPGFKDNPFRYMAAARIFVLSSLWEGFGNVVVEAMAAGAAVVSTDCPHGPNEIIREGESGLLVPVADPDALADAMERVLTDDSLHQKLVAGGAARAEDFDAAHIAERYGEMLERVAQGR